MMKKSLVALAALAVAGIASAQSSVTLFGVLDAGVNYSDAKSTNAAGASVKNSKWSQSTAGMNTSRIGFRGTEDLGAGMAASFWLEAGIDNDTGNVGATVNAGGNTAGVPTRTASFFNRRSTVSLSGGFGEVRIGRDYTASAQTDATYDPFGVNGSGTNLIYRAAAASYGGLGLDAGKDGNYPRTSNMLGYFLPSNLGGFYGSVQYGLAENVKTTGSEVSKAGRYAGGRFGYANGPLDVSAAYGQTTLVDGADVLTPASALGVTPVVAGQLGGTSKVKTANLGATYDFGMVKAFGEFSQSKFTQNFLSPLISANNAYTVRGYLVGATAPVGPGLIRVSYSAVRFKDNLPQADARSGLFALGYVYNLSKRTALYATASHLSDKNGASLLTGSNVPFNNPGSVLSKSANGYDFGVRHSF